MGLQHTIFDDAVTKTYADARYALGIVRLDPLTGKSYRFVKLVDQDGAVGKMTVAASPTTWYVTTDFDNSLTGGNLIAGLRPIGMLLGTVDISEEPYCWLQISGITTFTAGSAAIIAGDILIPDSGSDGALTEVANSAHGDDINACAYALATVADGATGLCRLINLPQ